MQSNTNSKLALRTLVMVVMLLVKYVSFDGIVELCFKFMQSGCLALKEHSRIMSGHLHKKFAHLCYIAAFFGLCYCQCTHLKHHTTAFYGNMLYCAELSVDGTDDIWFINFYSPRCSHCHQLAPTVSVQLTRN